MTKEGRPWTIRVSSSIPFTVEFPPETIIMGLSSVPLMINLIDGKYLITMPEGEQEISYVICVVRSPQRALILINEVEESVREVKGSKVDLTQVNTVSV